MSTRDSKLRLGCEGKSDSNQGPGNFNRDIFLNYAACFHLTSRNSSSRVRVSAISAKDTLATSRPRTARVANEQRCRRCPSENRPPCDFVNSLTILFTTSILPKVALHLSFAILLPYN